ncbi:outer membrane beta-barrel protein [Gemmatimonadota bacterium]
MKLTRLEIAVLAGVVFLALAPVRTEAQTGTVLGFRGGISAASASFDAEDTFSKSNRTGFVGGVFLNFDLGGLGFQVAGQYTQKGVDLDLGDAVNEFSLDYVEIPAVIKLGLPLGVIKPSVFGGAGFGFNTGCDADGQDCSDDIKSTDISGIAGADVAIYFGSTSLWADARYHFGLDSVEDAGDVVGDLKNRNWTFQAGLGFNLGG